MNKPPRLPPMNPAPNFDRRVYNVIAVATDGQQLLQANAALTLVSMTVQVVSDCDVQVFQLGAPISALYSLKAGTIWSLPSRYVQNNTRLILRISAGVARVETIHISGIVPEELRNHENRFYNPNGNGIIVGGILPTQYGGTGQDFSLAGPGVVKVSAGHVMSVAPLLASEIPALDAAIITSGVFPPARGGVVTAVTPDQNYFISTNLTMAGVATSPQAVSAANQVRACLFHLPLRMTINKATLQNTFAAGVGTFAAVGLYSADGLTKLLDSGTYDANTVSTQTNAIAGISLNDGFYFFAQTGSVAGVTCTTVSIGGGIAVVMNNQAIKKCGIAANASVAGVLPATLGAITATNYNMVVACFEP